MNDIVLLFIIYLSGPPLEEKMFVMHTESMHACVVQAEEARYLAYHTPNVDLIAVTCERR